MKIEIGKSYIFTKSGNEVRVLEPAGMSLWVVERVDGVSAGKQMIVSALALVPK